MSIANFNRQRAKRAVSLFPGIHLRMLQRAMNTSFNTTRYHVRNLERDGEIVCSREGGLERLYPVGLEDRARMLGALVLDRTARTIMTALLGAGPMSNGSISLATGLAKSTVSEHLDLMRKAELVRRRVDATGSTTYDLVDRREASLLIESFRRSLLMSAADRFIDLWDI